MSRHTFFTQLSIIFGTSMPTRCHDAGHKCAKTCQRTAGLLDTLPEILRNAIAEEMLLEVDGYALEELVYPNVYREHAKYWRENVQQRHLSHNTSTHTGSGLGIGESVEDLLGAQ